MSYSISISAFQRPDYLRRAVAALKDCDGISGWAVYAAIDRGPKSEECRDVILQAFPNARAVIQNQHVGIGRNVLSAVLRSFLDCATKFNLHIEEDVVVSPDALRLCQHVVPSLSPICFLNRRHETTDEDPSKLEGWKDFSPLGWCASRGMFFQVLFPAWELDQTIWDKRIHGAMRSAGIMGYRPRYSRSLNIGREGGTNDTPEYFDEHWSKMIHLGEPYHGGYSA